MQLLPKRVRQGFGAGGTRSAGLRCQCDADAEDGRVLRRAALVPMVQTTDLRNRHDLAVARRRDRPREIGAFWASDRCVARFQVELDVSAEDSAQPALVDDEDMIQAFPSK